MEYQGPSTLTGCGRRSQASVFVILGALAAPQAPGPRRHWATWSRGTEEGITCARSEVDPLWPGDIGWFAMTCGDRLEGEGLLLVGALDHVLPRRVGLGLAFSCKALCVSDLFWLGRKMGGKQSGG
jgi:hypothetical protein